MSILGMAHTRLIDVEFNVEEMLSEVQLAIKRKEPIDSEFAEHWVIVKDLVRQIDDCVAAMGREKP